MRTVSKEELKKILDDHRAWRSSGGSSGARANLAGADLAGANLADANLARANLAGAKNVPVIQASAEASADPRPRQTREEWEEKQAKTAAERAKRYRERHPDVPVVENLDVVDPFIVRHGHVSSITGLGDTMRGQRLSKPLATVCATNDKHLVAPIITKHYGGVVGHRVDRTIGTVTGTDHHAVTAAWLTKYYGTSRAGSGMDEPTPTATGKDRMALSAAFLMKYHGGAPRGQNLDEPIRTLDTSNRFAEVRAFLTKFYGTATAGSSLDLPFPTVTSGGDRGGGHLGLVMIAGEAYEIADIGMRMLQPHELFAAQGFPGDYDICPAFNGKPMTKTAQTALAGNSVCPQVAEALVMANARAA